MQPPDPRCRSKKPAILELHTRAHSEGFVRVLGKFGPCEFDIWSVTRTNMQRALQGKTITVPSALSDMEELTDVTGTTFRSADVLDIAQRHRTTISTATLVSYYVVFLNGYFVDDAGKVQKNVLGVTAGDSGVIAMFKPVIRSASGGRAATSASMFVEQSSLVHEIGHALGLVNSGIPLSTKHQDSAYGAHCTNERCVMYWLNEGAADATDFVRQYVSTGSEILFGSECLADLDAAAQK